jgi:hypothetical protein
MVATLLAIALAAPAGAQVKPGDVVSPSTAYKVKDLVSPGVYYKVTRGMTMDIVPTTMIQWPTAVSPSRFLFLIRTIPMSQPRSCGTPIPSDHFRRL